MAKKKTKPSRDNTDRLRNVAFWYWEYMRRNPLYQRYIDVINAYFGYFDSIGELDYLNSQEGVEELTSYMYEDDWDLQQIKFNPYRVYLDENYGPEAGEIFYKFSFLSVAFENKFKRLYRHYVDGIDVDEYFEKMMVGEELSFVTDNAADIAALLRMYDGWAMKVDGDAPDNFLYHLQTQGDISIDPKKLLSDPGSVQLGSHAIKMIYQAVRGIFEKQFFESETYDAVYKLSLAGRHINSSDEMRLVTLWLWDQAYDEDFENPKDFDEVYSLLKDKIEDAGMSDGVWEQILYRKKRIFQYFQTTHQSILQLAVLPLKSS